MADLIVLLLLYLGAGLTLKLGDDLLDEVHRGDLAWIPLSLSGFLLGLIAASSEWDLALVVSILIGVSAAGKVNRPQFLVGFVLIALILLVNGVPMVADYVRWGVLVFMLFTAATLDEKGNDWSENGIASWLGMFFKYRFALKVAALLLSVVWPAFLVTAVGLWSFDTGYEAASVVRKHLYPHSEDRPDCSTHP
jgi:hypothetical protein